MVSKTKVRDLTPTEFEELIKKDPYEMTDKERLAVWKYRAGQGRQFIGSLMEKFRGIKEKREREKVKEILHEAGIPIVEEKEVGPLGVEVF